MKLFLAILAAVVFVEATLPTCPSAVYYPSGPASFKTALHDVLSNQPNCEKILFDSSCSGTLNTKRATLDTQIFNRDCNWDSFYDNQVDKMGLDAEIPTNFRDIMAEITKVTGYERDTVATNTLEERMNTDIESIRTQINALKTVLLADLAPTDDFASNTEVGGAFGTRLTGVTTGLSNTATSIGSSTATKEATTFSIIGSAATLEAALTTALNDASNALSGFDAAITSSTTTATNRVAQIITLSLVRPVTIGNQLINPSLSLVLENGGGFTGFTSELRTIITSAISSYNTLGFTTSDDTTAYNTALAVTPRSARYQALANVYVNLR